jgi:hypothetical protein
MANRVLPAFKRMRGGRSDERSGGRRCRAGLSLSARFCCDERRVAGEKPTGALAHRDVDFANQLDLFLDRTGNKKDRTVFFCTSFDTSLFRTIFF